MHWQEIGELVIFTILFFLLLYGAAWYERKTRPFKWSEYTLFITLPFLALLWPIYTHGVVIVWAYLIAVIVGPILEYSVGKAYHIGLGKRLWVYRRYAFGGYTSLLAAPLWGFGGVLFYLLSRAL